MNSRLRRHVARGVVSATSLLGGKANTHNTLRRTHIMHHNEHSGYAAGVLEAFSAKHDDTVGFVGRRVGIKCLNVHVGRIFRSGFGFFLMINISFLVFFILNLYKE